MPGMLTPRLQEGLVRLGPWLPFAPAARMLGHVTGVRVSAAMARRQTERTGAAWVHLQEAEVARLERERPDPVPGPAVQQLSVDGAMVPLVGGTWGEVKLLAIGSVPPAVGEARTVALSYFGRRADHATVARLALGETHRRGTETAGVVGVTDGASWCQEFLDYHRPDAVRILDFAHATSYLHTAATAVFGAGSAAAQTWLTAQTHELKHGPAARVLDALAALPTSSATDATTAREAQASALHSRAPGRSRPAMPSSWRPATRSAAGRWRGRTRASRKPASKARACAGRRPPSIPWWRCARWSAPTAGRRSGRGSDRPCAPAPAPPRARLRTASRWPRPAHPRQRHHPCPPRRRRKPSSPDDPRPLIPGNAPPASPAARLRLPGPRNSDAHTFVSNCSDLRLGEEGAALGQGVQSLQPPGAEQGGQGHLGGRAGRGAGAAADLARRDQMAQAALGGVVGGRALRGPRRRRTARAGAW